MFSAVQAFLESKPLERERVKLLCETQVLLEQYVDIRHRMHEPYRVWRAASPAMLYNDFSRAAGIHDFVDDGSTLINACNRGPPFTNYSSKYSSKYIKMAYKQHLDSRRVLPSDPSALGCRFPTGPPVPTKTRLECSLCNAEGYDS